MSSTPLARRPLPARRVALRVPLPGTGYVAPCPARAPGLHECRGSLPGRRVHRATWPGASCARETVRAADRGPVGRTDAHRDRFGPGGSGGADPRPAPSRSARYAGVAT
jgi:hypothetical protein